MLLPSSGWLNLVQVNAEVLALNRVSAGTLSITIDSEQALADVPTSTAQIC
jgi:hypothetical protein